MSKSPRKSPGSSPSKFKAPGSTLQQQREQAEARQALNDSTPTARDRMVDIGRGNQQAGRGAQ